MTFSVRQPTLYELSKLSELCLRSKAVWGYDKDFIEACRAELTLRPEDLIETRMVVAEVANSTVGVAQVKVADTEADLLKLFVEPSNLHSGTGRLLFDWACVQAKEMGANRLLIDADPDAAPFYRHMGCHDVGVVPSGSIPGRMLPRLAFGLR